MKTWITIILAVLMCATVYADSGLIEVYEPGEVFDLSVHLSNRTGEVQGATCRVQIRNQTLDIIENLDMNEIGGGWYNQTYNTSKTGKYFCRQNCTQGDFFAAETCDFVVEGETMSPEAIELTLIIVISIIAFILLYLGLWRQDSTVLSLSGILFLFTGIFVFINGFPDLSNQLTAAIGTVVIGLGAYILIGTHVEDIKAIF